MFPVLFELPLPKWLLDLVGFLPEQITFYSYGIFIGLGIMFGYLYAGKHFGLLGAKQDKVANLVVYLIIASFVGGKLFFYLEDPNYYIENPKKLIPSGSGFVFYGSLLFAIPTLLYFIRKWKLPVLSSLDIIGVISPMVHGFGRLGCLLAGCCHGAVCHESLGIVFSHPLTRATPMHSPLYPTQIVEASILFALSFFLHSRRNKKSFEGESFLIYVMVYAIVRSIVEIFRGDEARGFIIEGILSHSQLISALIFITALVFYFRWKGNPTKKLKS